MEHLLTPEEVLKSGRPIGGKVDKEALLAYITEAEQLNIKPVLGDALFLDILSQEEDETYAMLLSGGTYTACDGELYSFVGLKVALSYFVFAKFVMVGDFQTTRYGTVFKESDYSTHISSKERSDAYNDALEVGNCYLNDCVRYLKHKGKIKGTLGRQRASGGMTIRKIGK